MEFNSIFSIEKLSRIWLKQISVGVFFACSINGIHSNLRRKKNACSSSNGNVEKKILEWEFFINLLLIWEKFTRLFTADGPIICLMWVCGTRKTHIMVKINFVVTSVNVGRWLFACVYFFFITLSFPLSLFPFSVMFICYSWVFQPTK